MKRIIPIASLAAVLALAACAAVQAEDPLLVSELWLDSDGDGSPDTDVRLVPTGTDPATDGLNIIAPGGVNVTAGGLDVATSDAASENGGLDVDGGNARITNTTNGEAALLLKNLSAGTSASIALVMQRAISGGTVRAIEWLGPSHSSGDGGLRINIPTSQQVEIWSTTTSEALAWVDDADGFYAPTVTAEDQVIIEGLGSTSAGAIHFTNAALPADTCIRIEAPNGNYVFRSNSVDGMTINQGGEIEVAQRVLVLSGNSTYFEENGIQADLSGYNTGLHFIPAGPYWGADYYFRIPGLVLTSNSATLTADDQTVDPSGKGRVQLDSDDTTAANRTFLVGPGDEAGHLLVINFVGSSSSACELRDDAAITGGNIRLTADWTPSADGTLSLIYDGADWIEIGRTAP